MKARIIGVESQMETFNYLFGVLLAERILTPTDNFSKSLQRTDNSTEEGQFLCELAVKTFESEWNTESFELFWENCLTYVKSNSNDIQEPVVPRARKRPRRYDENSSNAHFHQDAKGHYRQLWTPSETVLKIDSINQATRRTNDFSNSFSKPPTARIMKQNQSTSKHGRPTSLYSAMRELVCNGQLWARAALKQLCSYKARAFSSNSLVNTMDMTAAVQYIFPAVQLLGSQVYYKKSRMTILGLAGVLFFQNEQA